MFDLTHDWWELIARAAIVYGALLVMVRLSGKRTVGQFTPFDLLVVMLLSEGVSNALTGGEESVAGGLIVAATLVLLNATMGFLGSRSERIERVLDGTAVVIGRDGHVLEPMLARHRLTKADFDQALREADCELDQMRCAYLESDGKISILKKTPGTG